MLRLVPRDRSVLEFIGIGVAATCLLIIAGGLVVLIAGTLMIVNGILIMRRRSDSNSWTHALNWMTFGTVLMLGSRELWLSVTLLAVLGTFAAAETKLRLKTPMLLLMGCLTALVALALMQKHPWWIEAVIGSIILVTLVVPGWSLRAK